MTDPCLVTICPIPNAGAGDCLFYSAIQIAKALATHEDHGWRVDREVLNLPESPEGVRRLRALAYAHSRNAYSAFQYLAEESFGSTAEGQPIDDVLAEFDATLEEIRQMGRWTSSRQAYNLVLGALGHEIGEAVSVVVTDKEAPFSIKLTPSETGLYLVNINDGHFAMGVAM